MSELHALSRRQIDVVEMIPVLRGFARRFHTNTTDIDDLVQETLLRALASIDRFHEGTSLKSWLFAIMRNTFCTRYGRGKREVIGVEETSPLLPSINAPQEWAMRAQEFQRALDELPDHYRDAFENVLMHGESYEEAAQRCDCPVGTIKSRVNRARSAILRNLGEEAGPGAMTIH